MATILFTWELGANLGHVTTIGPIARELQEQGHRVVAALRDLSNAHYLAGVELLPACSHYFAKRPTITYADLLANAGFDSFPVLSAQVAVWQNLIRLVKPDLIVADHSPTALLAARCCGIPRVTIGTGFYVPPNVTPLPSLVPGANDTEELVLRVVNRITPMPRLADLYHDADGHFLTTFPELDHFGPRADAEYFGLVCDAPAAPTVSAKIVAYLRPFRELEPLLAILARFPTVAVVPHYAGTSPIVRTSPIDLSTSLREAAICISHGSHGTTATSLLSGCPTLMFPTQTEQFMLGRIVERLGCGLIARPGQVEEALTRLLTNSSYGQAARSFAEKHSAFAPSIVDRINQVLRSQELSGADSHQSHQRQSVHNSCIATASR